jgi:predicted transcriptional regulator
MKKPHPPKVVTYVRLSESSIKQLDQLAQQEETDRAAIIRRIVVNALRDKEANNEKRTSMV